MGSFTTLKSWISRSLLGTTEEIALLLTLGKRSSDQDEDEVSNDDIHPLHLRQVRLQERLAGKMAQVASGSSQRLSHAILYLRISRPSSRPATTNIIHFL